MLTALLLHISLALPSTPTLPSATLKTAVAEAAVLWSPYGVAIDAAAPGDWAPADRTVVTVVAIETRGTFTSRVVAAGWRGALGAITFEPNGTQLPWSRCS